MDVERREGVEKTPKTGGVPVEKQITAPQEALVGGNSLKEDALTQRRHAAERAARTTREMKDPLLVRIETVLSTGLSDEYAMLNKSKKDEFRKEGETLALWLHDAAEKGKISPHSILTRIERWLLIIEAKDRSSPWLLQEAYIRTRRAVKELMYEEMGH